METFSLQLPSGNRIEIRLRRSDRARRILLRMTENGPELVLPRGSMEEQAIAFARSQGAWLERHLRRLKVERIARPEHLKLEFTGEDLKIEYLPLDVVWTGVRYNGPAGLTVSGNTQTDELCILALRNWLKRKALVELKPFAADICSELGFLSALRIHDRTPTQSLGNLFGKTEHCTELGAAVFSKRDRPICRYS